MGKRREADLRKIAAFEEEMRRYAEDQGFGKDEQRFEIAHKAKLQMISAARARNVPIEHTFVPIRTTYEKVIGQHKRCIH